MGSAGVVGVDGVAGVGSAGVVGVSVGVSTGVSVCGSLASPLQDVMSIAHSNTINKAIRVFFMLDFLLFLSLTRRITYEAFFLQHFFNLLYYNELLFLSQFRFGFWLGTGLALATAQ